MKIIIKNSHRYIKILLLVVLLMFLCCSDTNITLAAIFNSSAKSSSVKDIYVEGYSWQQETPSPGNPQTIYSTEGITNLFDGEWINGSYNLYNGTQIENDSNVRNANLVYVDSNTSYVFSNDGKGRAINVFEYDKFNNFLNYRFFKAGESFITSSETSYINFYMSNSNYEHLQLEKGNIIHDYVPYGTWLRATNTDVSKNLLALPNGSYTKNGVKINIENGIISIKGTANDNIFTDIDFVEPITLEPGEYTSSIDNSTPLLLMVDYDLYTTHPDNHALISTNSLGTTFTIDKNITYETLGIWLNKGQTYDITFAVMLEKGSIATAFEPNQNRSFLINMKKDDKIYELSAIGDVRDTFQDGILTKRIGKYVITGEENWWQQQKVGGYYKRFTFDVEPKYNVKLYKDGGKSITSHYKYAISVETNPSPLEKSSWIGNDGFIWIHDEDFNNVDELKSYLKEQYNAGTPVIVYYILDKEETYELDYYEIIPSNDEHQYKLLVKGEGYNIGECGCGEKVQNHALTIGKTDLSNNVLNGTQISIYRTENGQDSLVYRNTFDHEGKMYIWSLKEGDYYYKEDKTPFGYAIYNKKFPFKVENGVFYNKLADYKGKDEDNVKETPASCFIYRITNGTVTITDYDVEECGTDVVIPKKIEETQVKVLNDSSFANKGITSLILPEGLERINYAAFRNNMISGTLEIPASVKLFDTYAFSNNKITSLILHEGLETIGGSSFQSNSISGTLEIPSSVKTIGIASFAKNPISTLKLHEGLENIKGSAFEHCQISGILEIPSSVKTIERYAFDNNSISKVILHDGIKKILERAFSYNEISGTLEIPASIKSIGDAVFTRNKIESVILYEGLETIGDSVFTWNNILLPPELPSTVTSVGVGIFEYQNIN